MNCLLFLVNALASEPYNFNAPAFGGLLEKFRSRVLRNARAAAGVEATTKLLVPILRYMTGPYFLAMFESVTWGMLPMRGSAPRTGQPLGPGGSFRWWLLKSERKEKRVTKKIKKETKISLRRNIRSSVLAMVKLSFCYWWSCLCVWMNCYLRDI